MTWIELVVSELAKHKTAGEKFGVAWMAVLKEHPPLSRDIPPPITTLFRVGDEEEPEPFLDAFYRYCDDAWHNRNPELRRLVVLTEGDIFPRADTPSTQLRRGAGAQAA